MGMVEDAKDLLEKTNKKTQKEFETTKDRFGDKIDEAKAEAEARKAEAELDSTKVKNDFKENLRN